MLLFTKKKKECGIFGIPEGKYLGSIKFYDSSGDQLSFMIPADDQLSFMIPAGDQLSSMIPNVHNKTLWSPKPIGVSGFGSCGFVEGAGPQAKA